MKKRPKLQLNFVKQSTQLDTNLIQCTFPGCKSKMLICEPPQAVLATARHYLPTCHKPLSNAPHVQILHSHARFAKMTITDLCEDRLIVQLLIQITNIIERINIC